MNIEEYTWFGEPERVDCEEHSLSELPPRTQEPLTTFKGTSQPAVFSQYGVLNDDDPDLRIPSNAPEKQYGAW